MKIRGKRSRGSPRLTETVVRKGVTQKEVTWEEIQEENRSFGKMDGEVEVLKEDEVFNDVFFQCDA
jgi:hypothetical protein